MGDIVMKQGSGVPPRMVMGLGYNEIHFTVQISISNSSASVGEGVS